AEPVKRRGGRVVVLCQPTLLRLFARCTGVDLAFDGTTPGQPDCHVHAPLMSVPGILGTTLETLPARVPYFGVDPHLVDHRRSVPACRPSGATPSPSTTGPGCWRAPGRRRSGPHTGVPPSRS